MSTAEFITVIVGAIFASGGFWAFVTTWYTNRSKKQNALVKLMLGIGHREIVECGMKYIERGYITKDEYEDLMHYLYEPYIELIGLGGDGTAERIIQSVKQLPIREH